MAITRYTDSLRPVISVAADLPTAWGRVETGKHGLRRSIWPGQDSGAGGTRPGILHVDTEPVPQLGIVTLRAVDEPRPVGMVRTGATIRTPALWREVTSDVTRGVSWLQYCVSTPDADYETCWPGRLFWPEPGVRLRCRSYAVPAGQKLQSFISWKFTVADDANTEVATLVWVRAYPTGSDGRTGWYWTRGGQVWSYASGGPGGTPGEDIDLRIRFLRDNAIVTGTGFDGWVTALPGGTLGMAQEVRVLCTVQGGMMLYHVGQMLYMASGTMYEGGAGRPDGWYLAPSHVLPAQDIPADPALEWGAEWSGIRNWGGTVTPSISLMDDQTGAAMLACQLEGTGGASPMVAAVTEWRRPVQAAAVTSPTTIDAPVSAKITLRREGRGQTCELHWSDRDGAITSAFATNGMVTVQAGYDGDALTTLFKGRAADPMRWRRSPDGRLDDPEITIHDDGYLLERKSCLALTGTWTGRKSSDSIRDLLRAAGIDDSRLSNIASDTGDMPWDFGGSTLCVQPTETILRALDAITRAAGWAWYIDRLGNFHYGYQPDLGYGAGTLDDSTAFLAYPHEVTHEVSLADGYANSIGVIGTGGGRVETGIYAPDPGSIGHDFWHVEEGEFANPVAQARTAYTERRKQATTLAWRTHLDFANLVQPWDRYTTGTLARINLAAGLTLRVEQVTWTIDAEERLATADYVATVEPA